MELKVDKMQKIDYIKKGVKDDYKEEYRKIPRVKEYNYMGIILD